MVWAGGNLTRFTGRVPSFAMLSLPKPHPTYIFEEEVKLPVILGVDRGLEKGQEDVLQHLRKVWQQLL
jgi:hypothetical protein